MATKTIAQLPAASAMAATSILEVTTDPSGTPVSQKVTGTQLQAFVLATNPVVISATAALGAIGNAINTTGKYTGKLVADATTKNLMIASGATAGSVWTNYGGGADITPA